MPIEAAMVAVPTLKAHSCLNFGTPFNQFAIDSTDITSRLYTQGKFYPWILHYMQPCSRIIIPSVWLHGIYKEDTFR